MKGLEGTPNDSEGLTNVFHRHGINMRYLGKVLKNSLENINLKTVQAQKKTLNLKEGEQISVGSQRNLRGRETILYW